MVTFLKCKKKKYTHTYTQHTYLCRQLLRDPEVLFAGYRAPHPLEYKIEIKITTKETTTPQVVLNRALDCLINEFNGLSHELDEKVKKT